MIKKIILLLILLVVIGLIVILNSGKRIEYVCNGNYTTEKDNKVQPSKAYIRMDVNHLVNKFLVKKDPYDKLTNHGTIWIEIPFKKPISYQFTVTDEFTQIWIWDFKYKKNTDYDKVEKGYFSTLSNVLTVNLPHDESEYSKGNYDGECIPKNEKSGF